LQELADKLREGIIDSESWKECVGYVRCAAYPDAEKAARDRNAVEKSWPTFATEDSLARVSYDLWVDTAGATSPHFFRADYEREAWAIDAGIWLARYDTRLQHALLHMNHHVHSVVNGGTGERRVLPSCRPEDTRNACKADFPLDAHMTETPLLV
jgi:hypothetical protein